MFEVIDSELDFIEHGFILAESVSLDALPDTTESVSEVNGHFVLSVEAFTGGNVTDPDHG